MTLNWPMVVRAGHRLLAGRHQHINGMAEQIDEICPAETTIIPPALYPEGALEKITGLSPWRTWEVELELIKGGPNEHAATKAFTIKDATISGPFVYKRAAKHFAGFGKMGLWDSSGVRPVEMAEATLVSCISGSAFFGPFLKDSLPQEVLAESHAKGIVLQAKAYDHEAGYRDLFNLPAPPLVQRGRIGRLTFFQDHGQTSSRGERYRVLHDRLRQNVDQSNHRPPVGVYLKRGSTGEARILTNEATLEAYLSGLGFDIVEPAKLTAQEIARRTLDAPIVISVEGSHMSHVVYSMAAQGTLLALQPPDRFAMAFKEFTDRFGMRFAFVVGRPSDAGFTVDLDELRRFMDQLL